MKKLNLIILLVVTVLAFTSKAIADDFYYHPDGYDFELHEDGTAILVNCGGMASLATELSLPDEFECNGKTYIVTEIGTHAFFQNEYLVTLVLGKNIQKINEYAFFSCPALANFYANYKLRSIEGYAFYLSSSLYNVSLNEGLTRIAPSAFVACSSLIDIEFPSTVSDVTANPFLSCFCLKNISVAAGNKHLAVKDGILLSKDGKILYTVPEGRKLHAVTIPEGVEVMTDNSARSLYETTKITLPSSLRQIGNNSLSHNSYTELEIPGKVEKIGYGNLMMCTNLKNLTVASDNLFFKVDNGFLLSIDGKKLYASVPKTGQLVIPDGVEEVEGFSFILMQDVKSVKFPDSMKKIGDSSFSAMYNLKTVDLGNSLVELGRECFSGDALISGITFPSSLKIIGNQAFAECDNIPSVYIPDGVTEIGPYAFFSCDNLKSVRVPGTITNWGINSFYLCNHMESVVIEEGVTRFGDGAFAFCYDLKNVSLPSTFKEISGEAFIMTSVSEIKWPENLESIGDNAFQYCLFEDVTLPNSVKSIGRDSFSWMSNLKTFKAGPALASIGENAFNRNSSMTDLYIPASLPPSIDTTLFDTFEFDGYTAVTLHVPNDKVESYMSAPVWRNFKNIIGDWSGIKNHNMENPQTIVRILNVNGIPQNELVKGINIVIYSDGSREKIVVDR